MADSAVRRYAVGFMAPPAGIEISYQPWGRGG
jgi:hypothetical protein